MMIEDDSPVSRRRFLQATGAGVLTASLTLPNMIEAQKEAPASASPPQEPRAIGRPMPELENPLPLAPDRRIGWAIVGLGDFAINQILPTIGDTRMCKLTAVVSGNAEKARTVAQAYGVKPDSVYSYDDFDRIRDNPDVQVVYIILPNTLHRDWTIRAARAGKHVFCEKPMAVTVADCQAMIDACARAERKLMIAYRQRFEPHNVETVKMIREGRVGRVRAIAGDHGRILDLSKTQDQWRARRDLAGGGSLYDIGIYNVNGARFFTGEEPTEVTATWREPEDPDPRIDVETGIEWTMRFPSGIMASFNSSYGYQDTKRLQVMGTEGTIELDPATNYYGNKLALKKQGTQEQREIRPTNQFAAEMDHFAECVMQNRTPLTPGEEGLRDVRILQAIYEAARTGRPVRISQT